MHAVIAAGGFGSRYFGPEARTSSKSLIEYEGKPLLHYCLNDLLRAGITDLTVACSSHTHEEVVRALQEDKIRAQIVVAEGGVRRIPAKLEHIVQAPFLLVAGHQVLSEEMLRKIQAASQTSEGVVTAYSQELYPSSDSYGMTWNGSAQRQIFEYAPTQTAQFYCKVPYVITKDIIRLSTEDEFQHSLPYYFFTHWKQGGSVGVVRATIPPEFDTPEQMERTREDLDRRMKNRAVSQ